jgi:16S rRNA (uracil1498-N3)-methyltransferase
MVFVTNLDSPALDDDDHHHLSRSLRVRPGEPITVADGAGGWRPARFGPEPEPDGPVVVEAPPARPVTVAFAPVKGDRSELIVQKLTELGIDRIVPIVAERSVVRWDEDRRAKNLDRHRRIAREAAMQSRNPRLPVVEALTDLARLCDGEPDVVLADPGGEPLQPGPAAVVIGPEGGFSASELTDRSLASLPGRILRTETAAIVAASIVTNQRRFPS